jgi:GMP synthase (glutamine-hydrolysing)
MFKDEVRKFGEELGIHRDLVMRHPFPGYVSPFPLLEPHPNILNKSPGIAIRILGEVTPERVAIARAADHIFISEIKAAGVYDEASPHGLHFVDLINQ